MNLASVLRGNIDVKDSQCIALLDKELNSSIQATSTREVEKYLTQEQLLFGRSILSNISDEVARACNSYLKRGDVSYLFRLLYFYLGKTDKDRYAALIAPKLYSSYKDGNKLKIKKLCYRRSYLHGKDKTLFVSSAIKHLVTDMKYYCCTYNRRASLQKAYYEKADNSINVITGIALAEKDHIGIERLQDALQLYAERGRLAIMNKVNPKYVTTDARGSYIEGNIKTIHRVLTTALYEMISNTLNEEEFAQFLDHLTTYRLYLNRRLKHTTLTKESMYFKFKDSYNDRKEKHLLSAGIVVCNPYTSGLLTNIPKRLERCI